MKDKRRINSKLVRQPPMGSDKRISEESESVSFWIGQIRDGESVATEKIWRRYFQSLADFASFRMKEFTSPVADGEEIAVSAFNDVFQGLQRGRFPNLMNRDDFWKLLICITRRRIADHVEFHLRPKRDIRRNESFDKGKVDAQRNLNFDRIADNPAWQAEFADTCQMLFSALDNHQLREIACLILDGFKQDEIAAKLRVVPRTIERKVALIRSIWQTLLEELKIIES